MARKSKLNIYFLSRDKCGYDEYWGKVVIAATEARARELANEVIGDEGLIWDNAALVTCEVINLSTEQVVLEAFNAG